MRMTFNLLHELSNAEVFCLFHNCMWQSRHSEVNVYFLELSEQTGLLSTHRSLSACFICVYVFVCVFTGTQLWLNGGPFAGLTVLEFVLSQPNKTSFPISLVSKSDGCSLTGLTVLDNWIFYFGWICWESSLPPATSESNSFIQ